MNSVLVVLNDHLDVIEAAPDLGPTLARAIVRHPSRDHLWGATRFPGGAVVSVQHASDMTVVAVGGNTGRVLGVVSGMGLTGPADDAKLLAALADRLGYKLVPKEGGVP